MHQIENSNQESTLRIPRKGKIIETYLLSWQDFRQLKRKREQKGVLNQGNNNIKLCLDKN